MASRRMFSKRIIGSARFIKMPTSIQALYFHLCLEADDDGVVEAYPVMRMLGSTEDDIKILNAKSFVTVLNEDLVSHITDWLEHNQLRSDRKVDSVYKNLLLKLVPDAEIVEPKPRSDVKDNSKRLGGQSTDGIGKVRLGKDRLKNTSEKTSFSECNTSLSVFEEKEREYIDCYDDGFTKQERADFFRNRRRKAVDVAKEEGMTAETFLEKMSRTKDIPSKIIHAYITHKKMTFENITQLFNEFQRNLKTAHKLKCYTLERINQTFSTLDGKDYEWTLETVEKKINELAPKKQKRGLYW